MTSWKAHSLLFALIAPFLLVACGDDDNPVDTGGKATPFTEFPTLVAPVSIENESTLKVLVPDGSGGWTDVTAEVAEVPCSDFFTDFDADLTGDMAPAIRFTSASELAFVAVDDPATPLISGTYTRTEGDYILSFESPLGGPATLYGHATDGAFYTPMYAICNIADNGSTRLEDSETNSIPTLTTDLTEKYVGDTVVVQVFEVKYEKK